jgi:hypothetical protein
MITLQQRLLEVAALIEQQRELEELQLRVNEAVSSTKRQRTPALILNNVRKVGKRRERISRLPVPVAGRRK